MALVQLEAFRCCRVAMPWSSRFWRVNTRGKHHCCDRIRQIGRYVWRNWHGVSDGWASIELRKSSISLTVVVRGLVEVFVWRIRGEVGFAPKGDIVGTRLRVSGLVGHSHLHRAFPASPSLYQAAISDK